MPEVIVMDICMPKMDGLEAVSHIRRNPKTRSIPILAATAKILPGDREKCLAGGCDGYQPKPFTHRELGAAIRRLLEKKSHQRHLLDQAVQVFDLSLQGPFTFRFSPRTVDLGSRESK